MSLEYLERLGLETRGERWLARDGDELRNIVIHHEDDDPEWLDELVAQTQRWVGWSHDRVIPIHALDAARPVRITTGDERGPHLVRAAQALADVPADRETWVVSEIIEIARALTAMAAHAPGFVHRRANDESLIIGPDGRARLVAPIAFVNTSRLRNYVGRGHVVTGLRWLAPEQVLGHEVSPATDVYQLAVTLHAALTGRHPVTADSDFALLTAIREGRLAPPPVTTDPRLAAALVRGVARTPADRFPDPAAFADALAACTLSGDLPSATARIVAGRPRPQLAPRESIGVVGNRCARRWEDLAPTADASTRHCDQCQLEVVRVTSIAAVIPLLGRRCVAFSDGD